MNEYLAGAIGGIVGGLAIAGLGMVYGAATDRGFFTLPNRIGGLVVGPARDDGRALGAATLVGLILHVVLSAIYGVVIAFVAIGFTHNFILTGLIVGIAIWLFNYYGVGAVHAGSRKVAELNPVPIALALHALFGMIAGAAAARLI